MLSNQDLEAQLAQNQDIQYVKVEGDGYHYNLTLVSDAFQGKSKVARQQWVYKLLNDFITSGQLHAVNMQTWTEEEWRKQHG